MYTKVAPSLVAILSILMTLVLGVTSQTASIILGPRVESEHVFEHDCPTSTMSHSQEFGDDVVSYALRNPKLLSEAKVKIGELDDQAEKMIALVGEIRATPGGEMSATLIAQMMLGAYRIEKKAKEMEVILNCPKGNPLSFNMCEQLDDTRANNGQLASHFLSHLLIAVGQSTSTKAPLAQHSHAIEHETRLKSLSDVGYMTEVLPQQGSAAEDSLG